MANLRPKTVNISLFSSLKLSASSLNLSSSFLTKLFKDLIFLSEISEIAKLINDRVTARADKDWGRADEIRDSLNEKGVKVTDGGDGVTECSF